MFISKFVLKIKNCVILNYLSLLKSPVIKLDNIHFEKKIQKTFNLFF